MKYLAEAPDGNIIVEITKKEHDELRLLELAANGIDYKEYMWNPAGRIHEGDFCNAFDAIRVWFSMRFDYLKLQQRVMEIGKLLGENTETEK